MSDFSTEILLEGVEGESLALDDRNGYAQIYEFLALVYDIPYFRNQVLYAQMFEVSDEPYVSAFKTEEMENDGSRMYKFSRFGRENEFVFVGIEELENLLKNERLIFSTILETNEKTLLILKLFQKYIKKARECGSDELLEDGFTFNSQMSDIEKHFIMQTRTNFRSFYIHLKGQPPLVKTDDKYYFWNPYRLN